MSPLHHLALPLLIAVFLTGAFGAGPGSGCTVKSRSSAQGGAHPRATASSEASAERGQPWGKRLFALLVFLYLELRYLLERHYANRKDDKWGKWEGSL